MSRERSRAARLLAAGTAAMLISASCGGPTESPRETARRPADTSPDATAPATAAPSTGPFVAMAYPPSGPAPCEQPASESADHGPYEGAIRRISASDPATVVFELCDSDVAFLSKIASPSLAINDTAWLQTRIDPTRESQRILTEVNGTGPFRLEPWAGDSDIALTRFDDYWGNQAKTGAVVFVAESDAGSRLDKLGEGSVDGVDLLVPADIVAVQENPELTLFPRQGLNVAYIGFNNRFAPFDNETVRQAIGIGIDRSAIVSAAFPPGTEVASHFVPCAIPFGCDGAAWPEPDPAAGRDLLAGVGFADGFPTTISYSDEARDYLPDPGATATALQTQLRENLGIEATLRAMPFYELTVAADSGKLDGIYLLGSRTRYPDPSELLERHFGRSSTVQFGKRFDDIGQALSQGRSSADPAVRGKAYGRTNDLIRRHVPMVPLAHVGSAAAFRTDVLGAHASATATERFATVSPGDRTQFVYMQHERPAGLYCADETSEVALRVCAQVSESLYRHDIPEPALTPALAEACVPDEDLITWTCAIRPGVAFHDGSALDANDVVLSYAVQWDADHPLHRGREGMFQAFRDRFGGFLNPPPASP